MDSKELAIVYFSGTGNSRAVAEELGRQLGCVPGRILDNCVGRSSEALTIVVVFPVYGWRIPPVVAEYIASQSRGRRCVMVATCGDDIGLVARDWRRLVLAGGGVPMGAYSVAMPNTYVFLPGFDVDSDDVALRKIALMPQRVSEIADSIRVSSDADDVTPGRFAWLKSRVLGWFFYRFLMNPSDFKADKSKCDGCGACRRECPMQNITADTHGRPFWGDNCAFCTACYHVCPHHAIANGRFCSAKGQSRFARYAKKH